MSHFIRIQTLKKWWQRTLVAIIAAALRLYWMTLRVSLSDEGHQITNSIESGTIFVFWHSNLFAAYTLKKFLKKKRICGLVSPSRDGAWLAEIFNALGIETIRGSSKRRGLSAIGDMVRELGDNTSIAITPDGPRGPACKFKIGTAMTAKKAKADVVVVALKYGHFFTLPTWDKFKVPLPFSRVRVRVEMFRFKDFERTTAEELTTLLEKQLNGMQAKIGG
ncbi:MAG: DUF374 domain-containing protein [Puniceicoccales bacterium]|jgi:lysophospholipid acyltransferase (LPLAT)-like uncharacterized protein|nr:DUF374 domain-containing protein [Puniceicoccales bacterium]